MSKYRTAMGKTIDMAALATRYEKTRAVGNMKVNARGDTIDSDNKVINDNTKRVSNTYAKSISKKSGATNPAPKPSEKINLAELNAHERELEQDDDDEDIKK